MQTQETLTTSGGEASYTVGQVIYTTKYRNEGNSVAQGVQQPYEISVILGIPEAKDINLSVSAYPNPTTNYLTVKAENCKLAIFYFRRFENFFAILTTDNKAFKKSKAFLFALV